MRNPREQIHEAEKQILDATQQFNELPQEVIHDFELLPKATKIVATAPMRIMDKFRNHMDSNEEPVFGIINRFNNLRPPFARAFGL